MRRPAVRWCRMARRSGSGRRAPTAVHVSGDFNGWTHDGSSRMAPIGGGHWAGFVPGLKDGDRYLFYVEGTAHPASNATRGRGC